MSLRSCVKQWKAASIAALSVLESTTRKFFCESGGGVTCYLRVEADFHRCSERLELTPTPAKSRPVTESWHTVRPQPRAAMRKR